MLLTAHASETTALKVQLNVFSGRPDPVIWITDAETVGKILDQIQKCPPARPGESKARAPQLGYRGFSVMPASPTTQNPMLPAFIIYRTKLEILRYDGSTTPQVELRTDAECHIEKKLIALLEEANLVSPELLEHIKTGEPPKAPPPGRTQP